MSQFASCHVIHHVSFCWSLLLEPRFQGSRARRAVLDMLERRGSDG